MIVVLGCDHCLRLAVFTTGMWAQVEQTPKAQAQRQGFRAKIEELIATHGCGYARSHPWRMRTCDAVMLSL